VFPLLPPLQFLFRTASPHFCFAKGVYDVGQVRGMRPHSRMLQVNVRSDMI
jgi:hypothetical protein